MVKGLIPNLLEIGKIKIGKKGEKTVSTKGNEFQLPVKLDHFLVTTTEKGADGNYIEDAETIKMFGLEKGNPIKSIPVRLLYNDLDLNFPTRYASYASGKLVCSGDGEKAQTLLRGEIKCPCEKLDSGYQGKDKCKINGTLSVIIDGTDKFGGCHTFRTTSFNTCRSILGSMAIIQQAAGGMLAFLPLNLIIRPKTTIIPNNGGITTVYIVSLVYPGNVIELQKAALEMATQNRQFLLSMSDIENEARKISPFDKEDVTEIVEEFYPNAVDLSERETGNKQTEVTSNDAADIPKQSEKIIDSVDKKEPVENPPGDRPADSAISTQSPADATSEPAQEGNESASDPAPEESKKSMESESQTPGQIAFGGMQDQFVECHQEMTKDGKMDEWHSVLKANGFEKANQIMDEKTALKVLAELGKDIPF